MSSASERSAELSDWASGLVGEPVTEIRRRPGGGRHEAWDVLGKAGGRWFLRADSAAPSEYEHYTLRREAEIYRAVGAAGLPVPRLLGVHPRYEAVLMEHVPGDAGIVKLPVEAQAAIVADFTPLLARLHAADPADMELPSLGPIRSVREHVTLELDIWESRLDQSAEPDPFLTSCFVWLRENLPDWHGELCLVQGDTGPGNFLHDGSRVTALLDFELAHLGDPMEDLAWVGTRNAQEPVPDFDDFLAQYAAAGGAEFDLERFRYHALFAELRIAVLGTGRRGDGPALHGDLGSGLIYGALHRRLTVEALAAAAGVSPELPELAEARDTAQTGYFDGALAQMKDIISPQLDDPFASQRLKSLARVLKYLREVDRVGGVYAAAELDDQEALLGSRPASVEQGAAELDRLVRAGELTAVDLLPAAAAVVARTHQLLAPAMGVLATRHLPEVG
jgi:aminoglycoside phosphotransferase (APT) family kinase protein